MMTQTSCSFTRKVRAGKTQQAVLLTRLNEKTMSTQTVFSPDVQKVSSTSPIRPSQFLCEVQSVDFSKLSNCLLFVCLKELKFNRQMAAMARRDHQA